MKMLFDTYRNFVFKTFNNLVHPQSYSAIEYFKTVLASMLVIASIAAIIAVIVGIIYLPVFAYRKLIGKISTDLKLLDNFKDSWDEKELKEHCPNSYKLLKKAENKEGKYEYANIIKALKRIRNIRIAIFIALIVIIYVPIILPLILMIMGLIGKTVWETIAPILVGLGIALLLFFLFIVVND